MSRTLVAGFGNVLRGDDGFGVEVVRRLAEAGVPEGVEVMEVGTAGMRLVVELMSRYDRLVVVDAMTRGGRPGSLYLFTVESVDPASEVDPHTAVPARALALAQAIGALPPRIFMVGCEPGEVDELTMEMSSLVAAAVEGALHRVRGLLTNGEPSERSRES